MYNVRMACCVAQLRPTLVSHATADTPRVDQTPRQHQISSVSEAGTETRVSRERRRAPLSHTVPRTMCFSCVGMGLSMAAGYTALAGSGSQSHVWFHKIHTKPRRRAASANGARGLTVTLLSSISDHRGHMADTTAGSLELAPRLHEERVSRVNFSGFLQTCFDDLFGLRRAACAHDKR